MLLSSLGASLLGNLLTVKGTNRAGEDMITAAQDFQYRLICCLRYYKNEPKFNGVYSRNNLPKITDGHMK